MGTIQIPKAEGATVPARPMGVVLSPDGGQVFVSLGRAGSVAVIDVASRKLVRTVNEVGQRPWGVAVSRDGRTLFTANGPSGDVSIIDVAQGTVTRRAATGGSPWAVVYSEGR
jgi:YVTN family beta-propeller protein